MLAVVPTMDELFAGAVILSTGGGGATVVNETAVASVLLILVWSARASHAFSVCAPYGTFVNCALPASSV